MVTEESKNAKQCPRDGCESQAAWGLPRFVGDQGNQKRVQDYVCDEKPQEHRGYVPVGPSGNRLT